MVVLVVLEDRPDQFILLARTVRQFRNILQVKQFCKHMENVILKLGFILGMTGTVGKGGSAGMPVFNGRNVTCKIYRKLIYLEPQWSVFRMFEKIFLSNGKHKI